MRATGFGSWLHLATRFFGALLPVGPRPASQRWALAQLRTGERDLFASMSGPDRRHAIGVARRALTLLAAEAPAGFVAAALLHDVGKRDARLGTFGRVWATLATMVLGRRRMVAFEAAPAAAAGRPGLRTRMARYVQHDRIGAELLRDAGSEPLTVTWAREHHLAADRWTVDRRLGDCLKRADGD